MPFVFDQTNIEGAETAEDMTPRADQFEYMLPAPEFHSVVEAARFSILPPEPAEEAAVKPQAPPVEPVRKGIMGLFRRLGSPASPLRPSQMTAQERQRQAKLRNDLQARRIFSILVPALRAIGVRRAYCRYDGGNDEGFAWLDRWETADGTPLPNELLGARLRDMKVYEQLCDAKLIPKGEGISIDQKAAELVNFTRETLTQEWAYMLLGTYFGTGEYVMYGAFLVDLEDCTITDDPEADPVVENIRIKKAAN
jgi:hypothetical protein